MPIHACIYVQLYIIHVFTCSVLTGYVLICTCYVLRPYIYMFVDIYMYVMHTLYDIDIQMYARIYMCVYIYIYYIYIFVSVCACVFVCVCMCVCAGMHVHINKRPEGDLTP